MSLVPCGTIGCQNRVREGLRRMGRAAGGAELADGVHCAPCRRRQAAGDPAARRARATAKAQLDAEATRAAARYVASVLCARCRVRRDQHGKSAPTTCALFIEPRFHKPGPAPRSGAV